MKLTILGKWSPYPPAGGACPGYLVEAEGVRVLLDCGSGAVAGLHRFGTAFDLTAAVITHLHPDHFSDIYALRNELAFGRLPAPGAPPLPVFAPAHAAEYLAACLPLEKSRQQFTEGFIFHAFEDGDGQVGSLRLRFVRTVHPMPCHAVAVSTSNRRLVYSADTGPCEPLEQLAAGADLFLCECTLVEETAHLAQELGHLTGSMAGGMATRAGVRRLLLTHFFTPWHAVQESRAAAAKEFANVQVVEESVTYEV